MVARGVSTQAAWLVSHDLLHHEAFQEPVLAVKQGSAEETDLGRPPARFLLEILDIGPRVVHVTVGGKAHRKERGRETLKRGAVLPNEVDDVLFVLAHVD